MFIVVGFCPPLQFGARDQDQKVSPAKRWETNKGGHRRPKRSLKREDRNREMGALGSPERSPGYGTQWLDPRGCRREFGPSGRMGSRLPQRRSNAGTQRGLSTPAPRSQDHRLQKVRDSGIDTGGTYGPGLTRASWVPEDRRFLGSRGVDASTPMPRGKDWAHE